MTDEQFKIFGLVLAERASKGGLARQVAAQLLHEVLVRRVTDELRAADE